MTDHDGDSDQGTSTVDVDDTIPPEVSVTSTIVRIWPPTNKMVTVPLTVESHDLCLPPPLVTLQITCQDAQGCSKDDMVVIDEATVSLRAERAGNGTGRTYIITAEAVDGAGHHAVDTHRVVVPHDQRSK